MKTLILLTAFFSLSAYADSCPVNEFQGHYQIIEVHCSGYVGQVAPTPVDLKVKTSGIDGVQIEVSFKTVGKYKASFPAQELECSDKSLAAHSVLYGSTKDFSITFDALGVATGKINFDSIWSREAFFCDYTATAL